MRGGSNFGSVRRRTARGVQPRRPASHRSSEQRGEGRESAAATCNLARNCTSGRAAAYQAPTRPNHEGTAPLHDCPRPYLRPAMSARREDIINSFWDDEDVDQLGNNAVLLYLWSFTNPRCGLAGVYPCKRRAICDGRLPNGRLDKALSELASGRFLYYIEGWIWVRARVKNLSGINPNMARSIVKDVEALPDRHEFVGAFWSEYAKYGKLATAVGNAGLEIPHV